MDLKIVNNSAEKAYFIVWGFSDIPPIDDAPWSYLQPDGPTDSKLTALPTPKAKTKDASKSNVDLLTELAPGDTVYFHNVPNIISGNVLISFNTRPQLFNVVPAWDKSGKSTIPEHQGWGVQSPGFTPGTLDANTIFCSSEFTLDQSGVWADTTNVDYFCAPITVTLDGSAGNQTSGKLNPGVNREDVFAAFQGISGDHLSGFNNLIMNDGTQNIRVLAPGHVVPTGIPADYYDKYVRHCLGLYTATNSLQVIFPGSGGAPDRIYSGTANPANHEIKFVDENNASVGSVTIPPGSAQDIFLCDGALSAPNNLIGSITAVICAALNRTVLHQSSRQPLCDKTKFYSTADQNQDWWATNWYSKLLHDKIGKVYGFAFDDVCDNKNYKPLLHDPAPTLSTITLESWT